jgi:Gpi18-like mannosyltransferase
MRQQGRMRGKMNITPIECRISDLIKKNIYIIYLTIITLISIVVRWGFRWSDSYDLMNCLVPWFQEMKNAGGLPALKQQIGNYNMLYQTIIALMTYLPFSEVLMYKMLSVVFDYVLAVSAAVLAYKITDKSKTASALVYTVVLLMPTVVMDSAVWGQCDSIYTSFIIIALILLWDKRYTASFIVLGIAFAFKLQFIFILPFFIYYYFSTKSFSVFNFLLTPLTAWAVSLPSTLYGGRPILSFFSIYYQQCGEYQKLTLNAPNIWALGYDADAFDNSLIMGDYSSLAGFAMGLAITVLGMGLLFVITRNVEFNNTETMLTAACWTVWSCIEFMPSMHERYTYLLDILMILLAAYNLKKYAGYSAVCVIASFMVYTMSLYGSTFDIQWLAVIYLAAYCIFTFKIVENIRADYHRKHGVDK